MPYKDKEKAREAARVSMQKIRQGLTRGLTVKQAEIDALPQSLKDDINRLCDSDPVIYDDREERLVRAVLYRRKFPDRVYHSSCFTGDASSDLASKLGSASTQSKAISE